MLEMGRVRGEMLLKLRLETTVETSLEQGFKKVDAVTE